MQETIRSWPQQTTAEQDRSRESNKCMHVNSVNKLAVGLNSRDAIDCLNSQDVGKFESVQYSHNFSNESLKVKMDYKYLFH